MMWRATGAAWGSMGAVAGWYARLGVRRRGLRLGLGLLAFIVFGWAFLLMWALLLAGTETIVFFYAVAVTFVFLAVALLEGVVRLGVWVVHR